MTKVVFKYRLALKPIQEVTMPKGARILHFGNQYEFLTIWAEVDSDAPFVQRYFQIVATGGHFPEPEYNYIGTATFNGGNHVWHLYEEL